MKTEIKKVVYLHGLESNQGGSKVDWLTANYMVYAPVMNYKRDSETIFEDQLDIIQQFEPDLIIGSSMGGYFADRIGSHIGCDLLLFNPATVNEDKIKNEWGILTKSGNMDNYTVVVLGLKDDVIDPKKTNKLYGDKNIHYHGEMGHRIPQHVFEDEVRTYFEGIVNKVEVF